MTRLLLASGLAALTAAGLAVIPIGVPGGAERVAGLAIRESQVTADARFLTREAATASGRLAREYVAARFEASGLAPAGSPSWDVAPKAVGLPVLAALPGRDPRLRQEAVLVAVREAGDEALGVAALLGVADAFAALPAGTRRTVLFSAFGDGSSTPAAAGRVAGRLEIDPAALRGAPAERARRVFEAGLRMANALGQSPVGEPGDAPRTALAAPVR